MSIRFTLALLAVLSLSLGAGCSKSSTTQASSESSSKSSSSPFKSSSASSGGDEVDEGDKGDGEDAEETSYQRDIRDTTARFATSDETLPTLQRDLSAVAESYGVTDWERLDATYVAIGRGLAVSRAAEVRVQELAIAMADEDFRRLELIRWGYERTATR